ncbi:hypothetical protein JF66_14345 [Cryobacterium sp. MLB-32]|nr:hypothetical protein JF66_14345 [Cryobacterium sp. MLB-32]
MLPTGEARLYQPAFTVQATSAVTDANVAITAADLTRVGDDFDVVVENQPTNHFHFDDAFGTRSVAVDLPTSFPGVIDDAGIEMVYGTIAHAVSDSSTVAYIVAPAYLFSQS